MVRSLPGTASRAVADAASGASERPTSQVVSPTTCDNIVNAVKVVDGFKGDVCSHAPPAPPESCKSGLESLWRRTCMTDGSNCDGLEHGAFTPSAVSNPRMQVRSRPTATQWQWRSDRRSTVAKRGRGTTGASADGDAFTCPGISRKSPMCWLICESSARPRSNADTRSDRKTSNRSFGPRDQRGVAHDRPSNGGRGRDPGSLRVLSPHDPGSEVGSSIWSHLTVGTLPFNPASGVRVL